MRAPLLTLLVLAAALAAGSAAPAPAPQKAKLQFGNNDADSQPFVEEVVVESTLHVRPAAAGRQARTKPTTKTSLHDGARVAERKQ